MSYLKLSRYGLLACILVWGAALIVGLSGVDWELRYPIALISALLLGPLAANALVAQIIAHFRSQRPAKHG